MLGRNYASQSISPLLCNTSVYFSIIKCLHRGKVNIVGRSPDATTAAIVCDAQTKKCTGLTCTQAFVWREKQ